MRDKIKELQGLDAYELADMVNVGHPDSPTSKGASLLNAAADAVLDDLETRLDEEDDEACALHQTRDDLHDTIDAVPSVYTHDIWEAYIDLAAYHYYAGTDPDQDMTGNATMTIYRICEDLADILLDRLEGN